MFRYFLILATAATVIYAAQRSELLGLLDHGPSFKVWVDQIKTWQFNSPLNTLNVQSREEKPLIVKRILMNDDPKCVDMKTSVTPLKLGEVLRFPLGVQGLSGCDPVKVLISTDRGESVYHFN